MSDELIERLKKINFPGEYDDGYFAAINDAIAELKAKDLTMTNDLKGRKVQFQVSTGRISGTVIYGPPCATGDAWIIADPQMPSMHIYVQTYEYMLLYPEGLDHE